jgi:hypothetical protein
MRLGHEGDEVRRLSASPTPIQSFPSDVKKWAVAWTKSKCEKALVEHLTNHSIQNFLPLGLRRRVYGGRIRQSLIPIFSGYVFFDAAAAVNRSTLFLSRHAVGILYPSDEIELQQDLANLARALRSDGTLRESRADQIGRVVTITRGTLKGLTGEIVRLGSETRLIVRVRFLSKAAELEIDDAFIDL